MRRSWRAAAGALAALASVAACTHEEAGSGTASAGAISSGCRPGAPYAALRGVRREIQVGSEVRSYLLDVPAGPPDAPRPVVLAFHGFRAAPGRLRRWTGLGRAGLRNGAIVAFPEGHDGVELLGATGRGWDMAIGENRDVAFVTALLDTLERDWCVDRRRIYATGMSNGGFFANLLGCVLHDRLSAVAPVAGARVLAGCPRPAPLAVLLIHGKGDRVVPAPVVGAAAEWWRTNNGCTGTQTQQHCTLGTGCRADVTLCEGPQGHTWPRPATRRIMAFFEAHARPD